MKPIKKKLWEHLFYAHGYHKIADCSLKVVNLKDRKDTVQADVVVTYHDDGKVTRQNSVTFNKADL